MEKHHLEITWVSLWRILIFVLAFFILFLIREILILLFLAIVISLICQPFVDFLQKKKIPRFLGTFLVFILILGILALFLWEIIPLVIFQFANLISNFNEIVLKIGSHNFLGEIIQQLVTNLKEAFDILTKETMNIIGLVSSIFGGTFLAITCLALAFYLTLEEKGVERFFKTILPKSYEERIISILKRSSVRISYWFQGRIILSAIMGLLCWLGLSLLGVKHSGTLALLTAVLDNIPITGSIFAGLLASLVALADSWLLAFWVIIFFVIINQLEGILFTPLIMKKIAGLSPLVVLIALLVGIKIAGLIGFLLAIPVAIILQEIYEENARRKTEA